MSVIPDRNSGNIELESFYTKNSCNETPEVGQIRLIISFLSLIVTILLYVSLKTEYFIFGKWWLYIPLGIAISQYLQGSFGI